MLGQVDGFIVGNLPSANVSVFAFDHILCENWVLPWKNSSCSQLTRGIDVNVEALDASLSGVVTL